MRKLIVLVVLTLASLTTLSADRIDTNPKPHAHLKRFFPSAVAFLPLGGTPLHYTAYHVEPQANPTADPMGYAFWTTDLVPNEVGYHGPIHILVGMNLSGVFVHQFDKKIIRDPFHIGEDVDAVTRASLSIASATRAIRDSSRMMARALLTPDAVKR